MQRVLKTGEFRPKWVRLHNVYLGKSMINKVLQYCLYAKGREHEARDEAVWKRAPDGMCPRGHSHRGWAVYVLPQRPLFGIFRAVWMRERREWGAKTMGSGSESIMRRPKAVRTDGYANPNGVLILYLYDSQCVKKMRIC